MSKPAIITSRETNVRVRLVQDTETKKVSIEVAVESIAKPNAWTDTTTNAEDDGKLMYRVQRIAETLAEFQCRSYGDMHDPAACGRAAVAAARDIMRQAERAKTRTGPQTSLKDKAFA